MTLSTLVVLHEWTDPIELHTWFNANVLGVADKNPVIIQTETSIRNQIGQGFDAIFDVDWEKDQAPLVWYDRKAEEEAIARHIPSIYTAEEAAEEVDSMEAYYAKYPDGYIKIDWDTAYAFYDEHGDCSDLHARFIVRLAKEYLEPRGITFAWRNEYSGEWNEGLTGFEEFGRNGAEAGEWFTTTALPAIAREIFGALDRLGTDGGRIMNRQTDRMLVASLIISGASILCSLAAVLILAYKAAGGHL